MNASSAKGFQTIRGTRPLQAAARLLSSMRFAIGLLAAIAVVSVIGTVLPQGQPYSVYAGLYGAFWADVFETLGFFHVYQTWWYLLMLVFLVVSTVACIARNTPKILRDVRSCKEDVGVQALQALGHKTQALLPQSASAAAHALGGELADKGWKVRLQERALAHGSGWMVAARKGGVNRIGYLAGHGAVVLICIGGLLDSGWMLQWQIAARGKTPYQGNGPVAQVPAQHRLDSDTSGFRGDLVVPEGSRSDAAVLSVQDGVLIQELPFALELRKFHAEYHLDGSPRLFASDVVLHDKHSGERLPARIAVNQPFSYRGVDIFQSGFDDGGSTLTLQAVPMAADKAPFAVQATVGRPVELDGQQPRTLEVLRLRVTNVEDFGAGENGAGAPASHAPASLLQRLLRDRIGAAHDAQTQHQWRDVGPSIFYTLRDAAGQASEFHHYMRPVPVRPDAVPEYLFGVRDSTSQTWRYLRIPADDTGGLEDFRRLHTALLSAPQRAAAVRRYAALAAPAGDPGLARQLAQSAQRVLARFAGDPQNATARRSGLAGVAALVEENVPTAQQEQAARAMLHILDGTLVQLLQAARQKAGLAPLDMALPRNQAFMHQVVGALSDAPLYPEAVLFTLQAFHPVQASVFQVTRAPGKRVVYAGGILLVVGVLAMLYVRERRLWIWLESGPQDGTSQALMAYSSNRRNPQSSREFARLSSLLAGESMHDHCT